MTRVFAFVCAVCFTFVWIAAMFSGRGPILIELGFGGLVMVFFWRSFFFQLARSRKRRFAGYRTEHDTAIQILHPGIDPDRAIATLPAPFSVFSDATGITSFGLCRVIDIYGSIVHIRVEAKGGTIRRLKIDPKIDRRWSEVRKTLRTPTADSPNEGRPTDWMGRPLDG